MSDIKPNNRAAELKQMYADEESLMDSGGGETRMMSHEGHSHKKSKFGKIILTLVLIVIVVLAILAVISKTTNWDILGINKKATQPGTTEVAKASDWQAVFLTNDQVYFGKLKNTSGDYPTLEDVYYLQVQNVPIQPAQAAGGTAEVQPAEQTQQQLVLVKFGTELHRPMDKMYLNKAHIMFFEDLSSASNVVQAIENYKKGQPAQ